MHCQQATELMSLELDHLLDEGERQVLEAHLVGCADCQQTWTAMQRLSTMLATAPAVAPLVGFAARVVERITQRRARRQLAAGYLVLTIGVLLLLALPLTFVLEPASLADQPEVLSGIWSKAPEFLVSLGAVARSFPAACGLLTRALLVSLPREVLIPCGILAGALTVLWIRLVTGPRLSYVETGIKS